MAELVEADKKVKAQKAAEEAQKQAKAKAQNQANIRIKRYKPEKQQPSEALKRARVELRVAERALFWPDVKRLEERTKALTKAEKAEKAKARQEAEKEHEQMENANTATGSDGKSVAWKSYSEGQRRIKKGCKARKRQKEEEARLRLKADWRARRNEKWHKKQKKEREAMEQGLVDKREGRALHRAMHPFRFKDLPAEVRPMIYNLSLFKRGGKKRPLLRALRTEKNFYDVAIEVYYKINRFQFSVDTKSSVEKMETRFLRLMRNVQIGLSFFKRETQLTDKLLLCTAVQHLTISTASELGLHTVIMKYLPLFQTLLSFTVIITSKNSRPNEISNSQDPRNFQQGTYFQSATEDRRVLENRMLGLLGKMLGQEGAVRSKRRKTWCLWEAKDEKTGFDIKAPVHIKFEG